MARRPPFELAGERVPAGKRARIELPVSRLTTGTWAKVPVEVVHGRKEGPTLGLSAALHGDEINGVVSVGRILRAVRPNRIRGTLLAVPIVNVFGFLGQSRYLPDRRDLNRSFPGSPRGSMASQLAHLFLEEIVRRCDACIDLHTGSHHRRNLPQIRADLRDERTLALARTFGAPVIIHSQVRDGSLRDAAARHAIPVLVLEAGEALRLDTASIEAGVRGTLNVMVALGMIDDPPAAAPSPPEELHSSVWVRAGRGGLFVLETEPGAQVEENERIGSITTTFGDRALLVRARAAGRVIGVALNPLVNRGDALVHIGIKDPGRDQVKDGA